MNPDKRERSRVEPILYVCTIITCGLVIFSLLTGYAQCGSASITGFIYVVMFTLGSIIWIPGVLFGLLIYATTKGGFEILARVAIASVLIAALVWVVEAQVYPGAEKTANRCSL